MLSLSRGARSLIYAQLARLLDAGLPPALIFETLKRTFQSAAPRAAISVLEQAVAQGNSFGDGMMRAPRELFPRAAALAVGAAERSGHLPETLRRLAAEEDDLRNLERALIAKAAYPILLAHMAVLAPMTGRLIVDPLGALVTALAILVPLDLVLVLLYRVVVRASASAELAAVALRVPLLGATLRARAQHSFFSVLFQLYEAGVPILDAMTEAAAVVEPESIASRLRELIEVSHGDPSPVAAVAAGLDGVPFDVIGGLATSEPAGELGVGLRTAAKRTAEELRNRQLLLVRVVAGGLFALAAMWVAYTVISFYADYYRALR